MPGGGAPVLGAREALHSLSLLCGCPQPLPVFRYNFDLLRLADAMAILTGMRQGRNRLLFQWITKCTPIRIGGLYWLNQVRLFQPPLAPTFSFV